MLQFDKVADNEYEQGNKYRGNEIDEHSCRYVMWLSFHVVSYTTCTVFMKAGSVKYANIQYTYPNGSGEYKL